MNSTAYSGAVRDAADGTRQLSDKVLQSAHDAVDTTRDYANDALDNADRKVRGMRSRLDPAIDEWTATAQRLARRSLDFASDTGTRAQQSLHRYADATERYVTEQPVKAVLIAAAAGAVLAALAVSAAKKRPQVPRY